MLKRLKIAYKKVHSFLFGQENEHIHTREERKQYYGRITTDSQAEAKMIHQYPKEGNFRFPLISDDMPVSNKKELTPKKQSNKSVSQRLVATKEPTKETSVPHKTKQQQKVVSPINQERKKFQGVNFKARNIPSPIYAFSKPPEANRKQQAEAFKAIIESNIEKDDFDVQVVFSKEALPQIDVGQNSMPDDFLEVKNSDRMGEEIIEQDALNSEVNIGIVEEIDESNASITRTIRGLTNKKEEESDFTNENRSTDYKVVADVEFNNGTKCRDENDEQVEIINEITIVQAKNSTEIPLEEETTSKTSDHLLEFDNIMEASSLEVPYFQEEVAATIMQTDEEIVEVKDRTSTEKSKQLEQIPTSLNTNRYEDKNEIDTSRRKTVVPFNVLMFHKDRLAQKKNEAKQQEKGYQFPTLQLLNIPPRQPDNSHQWLEEKREILELTLANFNVQAKVVGVTKGPSVTRFEIQPEPGVKVSKITSLTDDIKLSLAAKDIRIEAPIPGKNAIGIEVPNDVSEPVVIREILRSSEFQKNPSPLTVAMGLDIEGKPIVTDIQKMPHGLIAGATGSGKSVCINSILVSIMFKASPDEVKLMLVDPKMVELAPYNDIPHLVTPVITDAKQATIALKWAVEEMERRYELFVQNGVRDIKRYNEVMKIDDNPLPAMPYIVIVIDELADLMMVSPQDVEEAICRIAQKARACGIHLLLATQRPSVDVITGLIKANIPTRVAFSVSSQADSRTIIDSGGAERLLGKGDMLLFENGASKPIRVQGNFVSDEEIDRVIALVKEQRKPNYLFDKEQLVKTYEAASDQEDDLFEEACYYVLEQGGASSSSLQRRFRIGFNRAARLIDMMEARGIISEAMGSKPRNVLVSEEELSDRM